MSVTISIDPEDYIEDISDESIIREYDRRDLSSTNTMLDAMIDAYDELQRGRPTEAKAILERALYPKWGTVRECEQAYDKR